MSRAVLLIITILLPLLISVSCKSDKSSTVEFDHSIDLQTDQSNLKWLGQWYGEGKKELLVREMSREFMFLNQDINVELQFAYQYAQIDSFADPFRHIADSILSWVQNDRWPFDIFVCDKWFYADVAGLLNDPKWGQKHLVDFKNEDWFRKAHKNYVLSAEEYTGNFGDIAPGAYIEGMWDLLYASSIVEEKLGIKVKDYDMSIDDFVEYARVVYQYNQTHDDKITFVATNYQNLEMVLEQVVMSEVGDASQKSSAEQLQAVERALKKIEELAKYQPTVQHHTYATDRELKQEDALFHLHATWVTLFWQRSNPEGEKFMRPCEFPSMPGKAAYAYSGTYNAIFAVPKKAKNRDAAVRLMQYMSTVDIAEKWENYSKCPTGLEGRMSFTEFGTDDFSNFSKHMDAKYNNRLIDVNLGDDLFNGKQQQINYNLLNVADGQMTASQAIRNIRAAFR